MNVNSDLNNCAICLKLLSAVREFNSLLGDIWFPIALMDNKDTIKQNATRKHNLHRYVKAWQTMLLQNVIIFILMNETGFGQTGWQT